MSQDQKIGSFQPKTLDTGRVEVKAFQPKSLQAGEFRTYAQLKTEFGSLANTDPQSSSHFSLHPDSKKLLGVEHAERTQLESVVQTEVDARVEAIREEAYAAGFKKGLEDGKLNAETEFNAALMPVFENFQNWLKQCEEVKQDLYAANEKLMIQIILQVGRQVLLRELKTDTDYIKRLCSEVIEKVCASRLTVKTLQPLINCVNF